jgi:CheY-like chemotaxis protein
MAPALPVIGLTAHALAEERERCLAAGMVEHVSKPIDPDELVAAILRHVGPGDRPPVGEVVAAPPMEVPEFSHFAATNPPGLVDWQALIEQYDGREDFVTQLATMAVSGQRDVPAKVRAAAEHGDWDGLKFVAHSLKAIGGNLKAHGVRELAAQTEKAAREKEPQAAALAAELARQVEAMLAELAERLSGGRQPAP